MNEQDIVNKLKSDPRALKSVMQSQDGQALLRMLIQQGLGHRAADNRHCLCSNIHGARCALQEAAQKAP